jgi:hypothetical protein
MNLSRAVGLQVRAGNNFASVFDTQRDGTSTGSNDLYVLGWLCCCTEK